jgi:transposase-like protein
MSRPDFPKSVMDFQKRFSTEEACLKYMIDSRWPDGFVCQNCQHKDAYWLPKRRLYQCKGCQKQTSVTAGTVMHRSKVPLTTWFWAAYLVTTHTPGMSAVQFSRQAGIANYETAFMLLHKLRAAMVKEGRDKLKGVVEVDESFVGGRSDKEHKGRSGKDKVIVIAAVEARTTEDGKPVAGRLRLRVIKNTTKKTLTDFVMEAVEPGTEVRTDGWQAYSGVAKEGYSHKAYVEDGGENAPKLLPHVHRVFSNLKAWLLGTHHGRVSPQHLQAYLNEYVFRFNRRQTPMAAFQTVLGLADDRLGPTYDGLYGVGKGLKVYHHPGVPNG